MIVLLFPLHRRGPKRTEITLEEELPTLPAGSSIPERMLARELTRRRIAWVPQQPYFGGRATLGGAVVDFRLPESNTIVRVQGVYWHSSQGVLYKDDLDAMALTDMGFRVIDIFDTEIIDDVRGAVDRHLGIMA